MTSIYDLKPRFQAFLRPLTGWFANKGVTANQITVLACCMTLSLALVLALTPQISWLFLLVPPMLFIRMSLNAIDGMLAREHGQASRIGALLNEVCDIISDVALTLAFVPLALFWGTSPLAIVALALIGIFNEFCGVLGHGLGAGRRYEGPGGKSDRAFGLGIAAVIAYGLDAFHWPLALISTIFSVLTLLALWSSLNRLRAIFNSAPEEENIL